jgi:CRP/FNR family transcriptional regulator, cyclic AMP receptor protein
MKWRLLADVPDEQVRLLLTVARRRTFARGEVVFHRDDPADSLHLVSSGHFAVRVKTPVGETITLALLGPGENFGEMALVTPREARRSATVEALEPSETFAVYQTDFTQLRKEHPSIDQILIAFLAGEVRMLHERLLEALYVPAERRVLRRLVELAHVYGGNPEAVTELPLTQEDLATFAGTSRATVNHVLRDEEKRGTVELRRGKTLIRDLEALQKRAR